MKPDPLDELMLAPRPIMGWIREDGDLPDMLNPRPVDFRPHQGENRRMRLTGVAKFAPHPDMDPTEAKGLRRRLLKQRQRQRLGKLDVETRRLQRKATR